MIAFSTRYYLAATSVVLLLAMGAWAERYTAVQSWPALPESWLFSKPESIATGPDGSVYVADTGKSLIKRFSADGDLLSQ